MAGTLHAPAVLICVPTYNSAATLAETLDSILGQTYRELSVLVVDNASTDRTVEIAEGYAARDSRVRVIRHAENVGGEGNFTRCLQLADGDYTAIFHSDDIYTPGMVEAQAAFLEAHPEAGAVFTMAQNMDAAGRLGSVSRVPRELRRDGPALYTFEEIFRALLTYGNFFFCPAVMARSGVYKDSISKWEAPGFGTSADLDVWLRILALGPIGIIDRPLLHYRGAAATSFSYTAARRKTAPADMLKVFEAYVKGPAAALMGKKEKADFRLLILKDDVNRAFNYLAAGEAGSGRALLSGAFTPENIRHALGNLYHLKTIVYGWAVWALSWLPLGERLRRVIAGARFRA